MPPRVRDDDEPDAMFVELPANGDQRDPQLVAMDGSHTAMPCPVEKCLPGLTYCADHRPPYDAGSKRRYERRPSSPETPAGGDLSPLRYRATGRC